LTDTTSEVLERDITLADSEPKGAQAKEALTMARKPYTETIWYPVVVAATLLGVGAGLALLALRLLGGI